MAATDNTWLPAHRSSISVDGTTLDIKTGTYKETASKFDATVVSGATNANSRLAEQHGYDTIATSFQGTVAIKATNVSLGITPWLIKVGNFYSCTFTAADGQTHTGTLGIDERSKPIAAKGGYDVPVSGTFTGVVSGQ
jgi:hypothetical protein